MDLYNNLGISLVSFINVVNQFEVIEYSKALLIIPISLHDPLINYLKRKNVSVKGSEDIFLSKIEYFIDFNERYYSFLSISINTILVAERLGLIDCDNGKIKPISNAISSFDFSKKSIGKRAYNISLAIPEIINILNDNTDELYFKLRIEL